MLDRKSISVSGSATLELKPDYTIITLSYSHTFDNQESALSYSTELYEKLQKAISVQKLEQPSLTQEQCSLSKNNVAVYDENHNYIGLKQAGFYLNLTYKVKFQYNENLLNMFIVTLLDISENFEISVKHTLDDLRAKEMEVLSNAVLDAKEQAEVIAKACGYQSIELHSVNKMSSSEGVKVIIPEPKLAGSGSSEHDDLLSAKRGALRQKLLGGAKVRLSDGVSTNNICISQSVNTEWYIYER